MFMDETNAYIKQTIELQEKYQYYKYFEVA